MMDNILKPGRYIDNEWNAIHKEWKEGMLKIALCFPDIYEIGMSHLGMKILYGLLNQEDDIVCERVFAPWGDMEDLIRKGKASLCSLESKRDLKEFDIIGFSLQYEMNFTDVLNMLDLAGIPIFSSQRDDDMPLIIAGGPCAFNPEPMVDFIDAFVIGEAEEAILEITSLIKDLKSKSKTLRENLLKALGEIEGLYVPGITESNRIKKRIIKNLDNSYFPKAPIVPYIQIIHDRIGLEVMRGCPNRCRFCQACKVFYPLRIRSVENIIQLALESIRNTGYEEISLLSLSTGDYPYLEELICKLEKVFKGTGVKVSLPSIRIESFDGDAGFKVLKKTGLTFAPEAGTERLRRVLNKNISDDDIIKKSRTALENGWKKIKLYFMIGLPEETYEDLDGIIKLASEIQYVNLSISPFIPKPHSGFEREGMDSIDVLKDKIQYLISGFRSKTHKSNHIKIDFHNPEMSMVEAILSRGDKRIGRVIYMAFKRGARLQAWDDYFDYRIWMESLRDCEILTDEYLRKTNIAEPLPWDFIDSKGLF